MLKREITYEDFNGNEVTESFYFNLTKSELIQMESEFKGGMESLLQKIVDTQDKQTLVALFKDIILRSYGQKSDDGKRFIKNDALREEFMQTPAYDVLFFELATDAEKGAAFVTGILPKNFDADMAKLAERAKVQNPQFPAPNVISTPSI